MKEINSGRWSPNGNGVTAQRVAAGIRANPEVFLDDLSHKHIFVAITGRDGVYRTCKDVTRIHEALELDVEFKHEKAKKGLPDVLLIDDIDTHRKLFDELVGFVDTVYPLPESEEAEEVSETEEGNRPF